MYRSREIELWLLKIAWICCVCARGEEGRGGGLAGRQAPKAAYLGNQPIIRGLKLNYTHSHSPENITGKGAGGYRGPEGSKGNKMATAVEVHTLPQLCFLPLKRRGENSCPLCSKAYRLFLFSLFHLNIHLISR
jgi:hypothetical protein